MPSKYLIHKTSKIAVDIDFEGLRPEWATILEEGIDTINRVICDLSAADAIDVLKSYEAHHQQRLSTESPHG